jgi:hypothetical protein
VRHNRCAGYAASAPSIECAGRSQITSTPNVMTSASTPCLVGISTLRSAPLLWWPTDGYEVSTCAGGTGQSAQELRRHAPNGCEAELNGLGIPAFASPRRRGGMWRRGTLRKQVMDLAYIGERVFRKEIVGDGVLPAPEAGIPAPLPGRLEDHVGTAWQEGVDDVC